MNNNNISQTTLHFTTNKLTFIFDNLVKVFILYTTKHEKYHLGTAIYKYINITKQPNIKKPSYSA